MTEPDNDAPPSHRNFIGAAVWRLTEANKAAIAKEYAEAEASGGVPRRSNDYGMNAVKYGESLIDDSRQRVGFSYPRTQSEKPKRLLTAEH